MYVQLCYDNKLGQNRANSLQYPHTCRDKDQLLAVSIKDEITVSYTAHSRSQPGQPENPGRKVQIDQTYRHEETTKEADSKETQRAIIQKMCSNNKSSCLDLQCTVATSHNYVCGNLQCASYCVVFEGGADLLIPFHLCSNTHTSSLHGYTETCTMQSKQP